MHRYNSSDYNVMIVIPCLLPCDFQENCFKTFRPQTLSILSLKCLYLFLLAKKIWKNRGALRRFSKHPQYYASHVEQCFQPSFCQGQGGANFVLKSKGDSPWKPWNNRIQGGRFSLQIQGVNPRGTNFRFKFKGNSSLTPLQGGSKTLMSSSSMC